MTSTSARSTRGTAQRTGCFVAALVDVVLLVLINVSPGWRVVPFLTEQAGDVVRVADIGLAVGIVVNLVCLVVPRRQVALLGDVVTTAVALAVLWRMWVVFPFDFDDLSVDWATIARIALPMVGVVVFIALVVQAVALARALVRPEAR
ncbi:hypothetical protein [Umezawaea sp.]|uniref:hypothetical protein n=1 Tax=Umezawaea sp. TaxID=1955258 RepID=UPI002ED2CFDF